MQSHHPTICHVMQNRQTNRGRTFYRHRRNVVYILMPLFLGWTTTHRNFAVALNLVRPRIAVIGGGASGIFAAIAASQRRDRNAVIDPKTTKSPLVTVFEATSQTLQKVKISGGGRCNVLHDTSKPVSTLLNGYPRGKKELNGLFHKHFTPTMAREWFESRGVTLKTEEDGRMFPITDSSQTILDTLLNAAQEQGVEICKKHKVTRIIPLEPHEQEGRGGGFRLVLKDDETHPDIYQAVILATGSSPSGYALVQALEQPMEPTIPSLFTLNTKLDIQEGGLLYGLSGVSVPQARVTWTMPDRKRKSYPSQQGPLLITHHGLSGPAVLRLSAFAAQEFHARNYRGILEVQWDTSLGDSVDDVLDELWKVTTMYPKRTIAKICPLPNNSIPKRLWSALVLHSGFGPEDVWGNASKKLVRTLATNLVACSLEVTSKGTFKDEFVTAGGVSLKGIDMKRMESKLYPGLFMCGELLNVDGVTGGFNFMNCWSTGYVAGTSAVEYCLEQQYHSKETP